MHRAQLHQTATETVIIEAGEDSHVEYLPEPRILFPDAALAQAMDIVCAPGSSVLVSDAFTCHDPQGLDRHFRMFASTLTCRLGDAALSMIDRTWLEGSDLVQMRPYRAFAGVIMIVNGPVDFNESIRSLVDAASAIEGL